MSANEGEKRSMSFDPIETKSNVTYITVGTGKQLVAIYSGHLIQSSLKFDTPSETDIIYGDQLFPCTNCYYVSHVKRASASSSNISSSV